MDCIFCKIVAGEIPSTKVYEDDYVLAFKDIKPQAPVHIILIPKKHEMESLNDFDRDRDGLTMIHMFSAVKKIAAEQGLEKGYRVISNTGEEAAQTVKHLHFHILGGIQMAEGFTL